MKRIKFKKGEQRKFMKNVLNELNCPSLSAFLQFGLGIPYSTLKNYFVESRLIPDNLFRDMCYLAKFDINELGVEYVDNNWGKVKGGKKRRK